MNRTLHKELRHYLAWHVSALLGLGVVVFLFLVFSDRIPSDQIGRLWRLALLQLIVQPATYLITLIPYVVFLLSRSLIRSFRKQSWRGLTRGILFKILTPVSLLWTGIYLIDLYRNTEIFEYQWDRSVEHEGGTIRDLYLEDAKQRGIHVFNLSSDSTDLEILKRNNIEWITIVPYINQEVYDKPPPREVFSLADSTDRFAWINRYKEWATPHDFRIFLKPHIWLVTTPGGTWRSDIEMTGEEDWDAWFSYYEENMLAYAVLAERIQADMLCIGTELHKTVLAHPDRWLHLIEKIRSVYSGKLTYAANWSDRLEEIPFWRELDYIGVQAYFPIADAANPTLEELEAGWQKHAAYLNRIHRRYNKPILFTEIGYKSTTDAGVAPWEWESGMDRFYKRISHKTQALCYQAFFNVVWRQPWFSGAHIWQWQASGMSNGKNNRFTLEGKPALNVVAKGFGQTY